MFVQNFSELSAAVHELSCMHAHAAAQGKKLGRTQCSPSVKSCCMVELYRPTRAAMMKCHKPRWLQTCVQQPYSPADDCRLSFSLSLSLCVCVCVRLCVSVRIRRGMSWCIMNVSRHAHAQCSGRASWVGCMREGETMCVVQCNAVISDHLHQMPFSLRFAITAASLPPRHRIHSSSRSQGNVNASQAFASCCT